MSRSRKWTRSVVAMVRDAGMEIQSIRRHANGHLCVRVALGAEVDRITATSCDGDSRLWLNTRAQIRRVAHKLRQRHEQRN